jgi:hypothetical protein
MSITFAKYLPQQLAIDGTPLSDQVLVYTETSDGSIATHLYPQSEELNSWLAEGNEPLPAD